MNVSPAQVRDHLCHCASQKGEQLAALGLTAGHVLGKQRMSRRWGASCSRPTDTGMQVSRVLCCCHGLVCHVLSLRCLAVFWHHILWTFHLPWYFHMVLKMWVHADELKVMKWGEKLQTRPVVFILRHQGEHRLHLKTISPLAVLPGGDWWGPLLKDTRIDRSQNLWNSPKFTKLESLRLEFEYGVWLQRLP